MFSTHAASNTPSPIAHAALVDSSLEQENSLEQKNSLEKHSKQSTDSATPSDPNPRLQVWLDKLPKSTLRIDHFIARKVLHALEDEHCDSNKLAAVVKQDPILCLILYHRAEAALTSHKAEIQHLSHLISLLGLRILEEVIRTHPRSKQKNAGFTEELFAGHFAADLSSTLLAEKHGARNDRFYLPTLLFNAPLWMMWNAAPKTLAQAHQLASREQRSYFKMSIQKLGFGLPELLSRAKSYIRLPELSLKALTINPQSSLEFWARCVRYSPERLSAWFNKDKAARQQFYSVETGIYLLNQYTMAVYLDWHGKHIFRYTRLLCHYLNMEKKDFIEQVHHIASNAKLPSGTLPELSPMYRLQGLHRETEAEAQLKVRADTLETEKEKNIKRKEPTPEGQSSTVGTGLQIKNKIVDSKSTRPQGTKPQSTKSQGTKPQSTKQHVTQKNTTPKTIDPETIEKWLNKIQQCQNIDNALEMTMAALANGVGVEHCLIMKVDENDIHAETSYGFTHGSAITQFQLPRQQTKHLLEQLAQKPACISIAQQDLSKAAKRLPESFANNCELKPCGLLSIFCDDQPQVLIYCDQNQWDAKTHHHFKIVGKSLSKTLQQIAHP